MPIKTQDQNYVGKEIFTRVNSFADDITGQSDVILPLWILDKECRIILIKHQNYHIM